MTLTPDDLEDLKQNVADYTTAFLETMEEEDFSIDEKMSISLSILINVVVDTKMSLADILLAVLTSWQEMENKKND